MNYDDYLDEVQRLVKLSVSAQTGSITAANLGMLLNRTNPGNNFRTFGKTALSEVLRDLEQQQRVELFKTDKGALAVKLAAARGPVASTPSRTPVERFNPLKRSVWEAFVTGAPRGRRFMDRNTGAIRLALEVAPAPAEDWVEIEPVPSDRQRGWAADFIRENLADYPNLGYLVSSISWSPPGFAKELRAVAAPLAARWNIVRSAKVSSEIRAWLTTNSLSNEFAFQSGQIPPVAEAPPPLAALPTLTPTLEARAAILNLLNALPTETLLGLPIPAGVMVVALAANKVAK